MLWQRGNGTRWNVGGDPGKRCHQKFIFWPFWTESGWTNGGDGDGAGETEEEDYVETAHDMQDERLTSTLSNLFAHGCVAWLQCRLFSEMYGIK